MPRLRRSDIVVNSFSSCVSNASEEFSRAPEVPMCEIISQPRMFPHQLESTVPFKQLQCSANTHCWRQLNKEMDVVDSNMKLVDFTSMFNSYFIEEPFTISFDSIKLERVHSVFRFPDKMEGILSEGMFKILQIHFFAPQNPAGDIAHAKSVNLVHEGKVNPRDIHAFQELNFNGGRFSSPA
jgi:hypothetical protein